MLYKACIIYRVWIYIFPGISNLNIQKLNKKISENHRKKLQNSEEEKKLVPRHLWKFLFPTLIDASYVYYNGSILCQYIYIYLYSDTSHNTKMIHSQECDTLRDIIFSIINCGGYYIVVFVLLRWSDLDCSFPSIW